jgi:antitoxin VapB
VALSIKDDRTDALARELASLTGESLTTAVRVALHERLEREARKRARAGLGERLLEIGARCAARIKQPATSLDHGDLLYDERGLPR